MKWEVGDSSSVAVCPQTHRMLRLPEEEEEEEQEEEEEEESKATVKFAVNTENKTQLMHLK
jgi:hypothetical protein